MMQTFESRQKLIDNIIKALVESEVDGINVDFENMYKEDKDKYSRFLIELRPRIKEIGKTICVDVTEPDGSDTWSLCYDRHTIGMVADYVIFIGYDQHTAGSTSAGSVASANWVELNITKFLGQEGIPKETACRDLQSLLSHGKTLLAAYNAQFDLAFLYHFLLRDGDPAALDGVDFLDALTVFKDRRPYPHKLRNAIEAYELGGKVVNSHRAIDDVLATVEVLSSMAAERGDLVHYINLFGFHPKYGVSGRPLAKVLYAPQPYGSHPPLYETARPTAAPLARG